MVSALDSGLSGLGLSPGQGHCVVFWGKTHNSPSAFLHPGPVVQRMDSAFHQINHYPVDRVFLDSDLSCG